jgi:hypothetical protein
MSPSDLLITTLILGAAVWLLYRSVWKKQGHCAGCASGCAAPGEPARPVTLGRPRPPGER